MAAHFAYDAATGALYPAARPSSGAGLGALYGVLVWTASYLSWIPGARILKPATRHPGRRNGLMIASHLVWESDDGRDPPRAATRQCRDLRERRRAGRGAEPQP